VEYGKSIYVPSFGWAVIGRLGNDLNAAQVLSSLDAEWKLGQAMGKNETFSDKICMFQVNPISALTVTKCKRNSLTSILINLKFLSLLIWQIEDMAS
jgi:hypothetical protein